MGWWRGQNLEGPVLGPDGREWHFRVWHGAVEGVMTQRIFFWDDARGETGMLEVAGDQTLHVRRIRDRIRRIAKDDEYRGKFIRELSFPVDRHY